MKITCKNEYRIITFTRFETRTTHCKRWDCAECREYKLAALNVKIKLVWGDGVYLYYRYFPEAFKIVPPRHKINGAVKVLVPADDTVFVISGTSFTGAKRIRRKKTLRLIRQYAMMEHQGGTRRLSIIGGFKKLLLERLNKDCELSDPYERNIFESLQSRYSTKKADGHVLAVSFKRSESEAFWDEEDQRYRKTYYQPDRARQLNNLYQGGHLTFLTEAGRKFIKDNKIKGIIYEDDLIQTLQNVDNEQDLDTVVSGKKREEAGQHGGANLKTVKGIDREWCSCRYS